MGDEFSIIKYAYRAGVNLVALMAIFLFGLSCAKKSESSSSNTGVNYDFTSTASAKIKLSGTPYLSKNYIGKNVIPMATGPTLCSSVVCFTPTSLTGKYFGIGFSIQSSGQGMVAYFGQESWKDINGASPMFSFDAKNPITNSGNLYCCGGSGDLSSENTYIESVIYLFSYLDVTFTVAGVTGNTTMNNEFTLRFVFADGGITSGLRGDILIKDSNLPLGQGGMDDGQFKWVSASTGALSTSRPADPVTMDTSVTNYVNPFGATAGNQSIPVIYAGVLTSTNSGLFTIKETDLKATGRTYSFSFDPTNFVMFPALQNGGQDINMIFSLKGLMQKVHLGGLPFSQQSRGVGSPASTVLTVTDAQ